MRSLPVLFALLGACGTTPDERPVTVEVVALSVLAPSCGQTQCHSTSTYIQGYAFNTLDAAKDALREIATTVQGETAADTLLIDVMRTTGGKRMPPDAPLAEQDIQLVEAWIDSGSPGL